MLEQILIQDATPTVRPVCADSAPALSIARQAQVDACLEHLCARAGGAMPQRARQELRDEMQTALQQLIAAHQELGSDLDTATVAALQQLRLAYAAPVTVQHAKVRTNLLHRFPGLRAAMLPLSLFSAFYIADATHFAWNVWAHITGLIGTGPGQIADDAYMGLTDGPAVTAFYRFELLVIPLLVGLIAGVVLRQRAGRAVLTSLALLTVVAILLPGFVMGLSYAGLWPLPINLPQGLIPSPAPGLSGVTFWATLGYAGAQIGNRLRRHSAVLVRRTRAARSENARARIS
jgi:hypothetical protein